MNDLTRKTAGAWQALLHLQMVSPDRDGGLAFFFLIAAGFMSDLMWHGGDD